MPLSELDKLLLGEPEPKLSELDKLLLGEAPIISEPEEEPTWWGEAWKKTKGFGEWLFPRGVQDLPRQYGAALQKGGMAAGEAMTWLVRLLPGNEDRKPYAEQTTAEQAWTVSQAGATIGAVTAAVGMGIDTIKGLKTYLKGTELKKGYKVAPYTEEMVEKGVPPKTRPIPRYKIGGLKGEQIPGAKASILRPGVEVTRVVKPAKPEIATEALKQLSQKVQAVEMVKKADIVDDFTMAIKQALTAKTVGTQATQTAISNAAQTITNDITAVIPAQFSGEFAATLIDEAINKLDLAVNIISTGMEYTEPKYTRPIEEEIVEKELAKPLEEEPLTEKDLDTIIEGLEPEAKPTVVPEIPLKEDLTLAMRDTKTGEIITATPDEKIHTDMIPRLRERISDKDMEPGWVDSKGKFYDVFSGRRTLAGFIPTEIAPKAKEPWKMTREELEADPRFVIKTNITRATIINKEKVGLPSTFFDRSKVEQEQIIKHELAHLKVHKLVNSEELWKIIDSHLFGKYDKELKEFIPREGFYQTEVREILAESMVNYKDDPIKYTELHPKQAPLIKSLVEGTFKGKLEIAPKAKLPPSMEQEISMGGGPILGAGMELTAEKPFEVKEKGAFKKAIDNAVKNFSVYTRIKKENPEAYRHFREFKGGQQLALINAKEITYETWGKINRGEAMAIQRAVQIPKEASKLSENLRETYTKVKDVLEDRKQQLIDMGKMTVGWPQSYIAKLDKEKEKLLEEVASLVEPRQTYNEYFLTSDPAKKKMSKATWEAFYKARVRKHQEAVNKRQSRIIEIDELKKVLSKREFFPADYLTKPETQSQILKLLPENKWRNSQLRSKFRAGKFVPDIDTAIKWGLEPVDARASFMDYMTWFEEQKNTYILYQGLKDIPDAVMKPTKNNPPPQDWKEVIGISELKGYYANPFIEDVLTEFNTKDVRTGLEKAYMEVARWGKMASFYNPIIMGGVYDPQQGYMAAGLRALNPITYVKSIISVKAEDEFYKQCVAADLFPKPVDLGPEKNMDKLILSVAKQMDKDVPKVTKLIEDWTNGEWNFKGKSNTRKMLDGIKGLYSAEWNLTWGLDAASRMTTVKALLAQGWEFNDAVERARFYHADYGDLPGATRRFANYFMWTPSYQAAMAKVYTNMVAHPIKEKGPLLRWIGFWLLVGTGMSIAGYKFDRYRWTKDTKDGMQDVIMMPGPLAWPFKTILRNPLLGAYWQSSVPINIFLSLRSNYDGLGAQIYDPKADKIVQAGQQAEFVLERFFRPLEATRRLTDTERKITDRLMSLVAAMKYQRKKPKEKKKPVERWWE